ncbi:hypothetical protein SBRCBS47491_000465 [Sporothrix bragantina]|uniref:Ubiquitin interaction motif protein n=1 Tax=Sporothrix bragantina TaxID=671064 RepID=A0ABP0AQH0_9PEZI
MDDPSESSIAEVCEFASLDPVDDRALVIAALRAKNGSIQDVVLSYYDDPSKFRQLYTWDETSFIGDRDGLNGSPLPSFNIQGPDDNGSSHIPIIHGVSPNNYHNVAPSRPPSRAQSPLSRVAEWNGADAGVPSSLAQEDKELERALAESAAMSGLQTPQETGVTNDPYAPIGPQLPTDLPFFGPASRDAYDPDQWAMVHKTLEPQEPGPSGRMRAEGTPAFLRSRQTGQDASTLSALLTVLHAIPLARNSFLAAGEQPVTYGQNSEWWKGGRIDPTGVPEPDQTMRLNSVINVDSDEDIGYEQPSLGSEGARELIDEIHRLMAFLDSTTRAYGTADRVADSRMVRDCYGIDTDQKLFEALRRLALPAVERTFYSNVQLLAIMDLKSPTRSESYAILDIKVDSETGANGPLSASTDLYSAMDNLYWEDLYRFYPGQQRVAVEDSNMAIISRIAPVQILHLNVTPNQDAPKNFDVPAVLYPDRYLGENKDRAVELQLKLQKVYDALINVDKLLYQIKTYMDVTDPNQPIARDKVILSEQAINFAVQKEWQQKARVAWERYTAKRNANKDPKASTSGHEFDFSVADIDAAEPATEEERSMRRLLQAEIAVHIRKLKSMRRKTAKLDAEKEALEELARRIRKKYTVPSVSENWYPTHKYVLRGVIVSPSKFYFCRREGIASQEPKVPEMTEVSKASEEQLPDAAVDAPAGISAEGPQAHEESEIKAGQDGQEDGKEKEKAVEETETASHQTPTSGLDQWWMVVYNSQDASPITVEKSTVDIARAAAFNESRALTLVYAEESILDESNASLSSALDNFMRFDNRFFKQELKEESPRSEKKRQPAEEASPTSPLKRHQRQRSTSIDSLASNMASLGDDSNYGDGYLTGMEDIDMEEPLLSYDNNERFPTDADEGAYDAGHSRPFNNNDMHSWRLSQTLVEEIEAKQQERQSSDFNTNVSGMDMTDVVMPQREIDTPAMFDAAIAEPTPAPVPADSTPASTTEPEIPFIDVVPDYGTPTPKMAQMAIDADSNTIEH